MILLGDAPYYARFGFTAAKTGELSLPGAVRARAAARPRARRGALDGAWGMIAPAGAPLRPKDQAQPAPGRHRSPCRTRRKAGAMAENLPVIDGARPRWRGLVTTVMLVLISVMIVRDILIRRWTGAAPRRRHHAAVPLATAVRPGQNRRVARAAKCP